jgi:hypothetical protein
MVVRHRSSGLHAYVLTVSAVGFGSLALLASQGGLATVRQLPPVFWALLICLVVVESLPLVLPRSGNEVITTAETFAFAILLGWGPAAAAFAMTVALLISDVLRRADPERVIFNIGQYGLLITVSGGVYEVLGAGRPFTAEQLPAFVAAAAVFFLGNLLLVGGVTTLAYGRDFVADLKDALRVEARPYAMVFGMAPIMLVVAEQEVRLLPLVLLPLFAVRVALKTAVQSDQQRAAAEEAERLAGRLHYPVGEAAMAEAAGASADDGGQLDFPVELGASVWNQDRLAGADDRRRRLEEHVGHAAVGFARGDRLGARLGRRDHAEQRPGPEGPDGACPADARPPPRGAAARSRARPAHPQRGGRS